MIVKLTWYEYLGLFANYKLQCSLDNCFRTSESKDGPLQDPLRMVGFAPLMPYVPLCPRPVSSVLLPMGRGHLSSIHPPCHRPAPQPLPTPHET
jgi:hypothetical protein